MKKIILATLAFFVSLFFILSCTIESEEDEPVILLSAEEIKINLKTGSAIKYDTKYNITIDQKFNLNWIKVSIGNKLIDTLKSKPFEFSIDKKDFEEGVDTLKISAFTNSNKIFKKSLKIIIDKTGPVLKKLNLEDGVILCDEVEFKPEIIDEITSVDSVKFYVGDTLYKNVKFKPETKFSINPNDFSGGSKKSKFVMIDSVGNTSEKEFEFKIGKPLVDISFPEKFVRENVEKFYVVLSDKKGNYISHKVYNNKADVIKFCSHEIVDADTEYMLTFFEVFDDSIFNVFCYSNLTKKTVGEKITFLNRSLPKNTVSKEFNTSHLNFYEYTRASGNDYSMVLLGNQKFSGHASYSFIKDLGTSKAFIMSYDRLSSKYKWAFIDNFHQRTDLLESDFSSNNVKSKEVNFSTNVTNQSLTIKGYENNKLFNVFNGHDLYSTPMNYLGNQNYKYQFADIFQNYFYSLKANNYYLQGKGLPKSSIDVPSHKISYNLSSDKITFNGIDGYEVGRVRLEKSSVPNVNITSTNPSVTVEFIFDGKSKEVFIPKLPKGIFSDIIHQTFNNINFKEIQGISENYSNYNSYSDYIKNVLVVSKPFFLTSDYRERIFHSNVSSHVLPVWEFPYYARF